MWLTLKEASELIPSITEYLTAYNITAAFIHIHTHTRRKYLWVFVSYHIHNWGEREMKFGLGQSLGRERQEKERRQRGLFFQFSIDWLWVPIISVDWGGQGGGSWQVLFKNYFVRFLAQAEPLGSRWPRVALSCGRGTSHGRCLEASTALETEAWKLWPLWLECWVLTRARAAMVRLLLEGSWATEENQQNPEKEREGQDGHLMVTVAEWLVHGPDAWSCPRI